MGYLDCNAVVVSASAMNDRRVRETRLTNRARTE